MAGMIATKLDMTRVIKDDKFIPITLLKIPKLKIVGFKTVEKDGYSAMIVGIQKDDSEIELGEGKTTLSKNKFSYISEFPVSKGDLEKYKVGDSLGVNILEGIVKVSIEGFTKGKGFTGAMKKHNFHGGPGGHGSKFHRALGSIGNRKPTRTHKGKKMHGHHGNTKVTLKKIPIELVNNEISVVGVRGGVPGGRNSKINLIF